MAKNYTFGELGKEYNSKTNSEVEVWITPKYKEAKKKAIEALESDMYKDVLDESDFWILKNATKTGKIAYTGLIISHNGCLKINDKLPAAKKFKPSCVTIDKDGYKSSLVYTYINDEQGLYEVGEVNAANCKNEYPYAMAIKRCMDRVILKNSKLAYSGIYSDSESDEFKNDQDESETPSAKSTKTGAKTTRVKTKPETPTTGNDKEARKALVNYCNNFKIDIKDVAATYHLNNNSSEGEFWAAIESLRTIYGDTPVEI